MFLDSRAPGGHVPSPVLDPNMRTVYPERCLVFHILSPRDKKAVIGGEDQMMSGWFNTHRLEVPPVTSLRGVV